MSAPERPSFTKSSYPCVGYHKVQPYKHAAYWRFVDASDGAEIGRMFPTKAELLAALPEYAKEYGCNGCEHPGLLPEWTKHTKRVTDVCKLGPPSTEPTTQQVYSALEQAIQEVCDEDTQNDISDVYRRIMRERGFEERR